MGILCAGLWMNSIEITGRKYRADEVFYQIGKFIWLPFLAAGFLVKFLFFIKKGFGGEYLMGLREGIGLCKRDKKVRFMSSHIQYYCKIQLELWINMLKILEK